LDGQLAVAFDTSIAPTFLDPAETPGPGPPFVILYALHGALTKARQGNDMAPRLAQSWRASADWLVYECKLREGLRFDNGDPFTRGTSASASGATASCRRVGSRSA
jgi:peptide/nickel transport system substrate-binding protein